MSGKIRIKPMKKSATKPPMVAGGNTNNTDQNASQQLADALKTIIKQAISNGNQITAVEVMSIIDKAVNYAIRWATVKNLQDAKPMVEATLLTVLDELKNENILKPEIADFIASAAGIALNTIDIGTIENIIQNDCKGCKCFGK